MTMIVFRIDDITPDMNWEGFYKYMEMFRHYRIRPLLGVVPDNQDPDLMISRPKPSFWEELRDLVSDGNLIAQHGYKHTYVTKDGGLLGINKKSEFASLPFKEQYDKILKGQRILIENGLFTDIWMAPAHSYDNNTLCALKALGFRYVTDGYSLYPYDFQGLRFIPCQMAVPRKLPFGLFTICIHANTASPDIFEKIHSFIKNNRKIVYDYKRALSCPPINIANRWSEKIILALLRKK